MIKPPCKPECKDRSPTCHGNCERYKLYRIEIDKRNAERRKNYDADAVCKARVDARIRKEQRLPRIYGGQK